MKTSSTFSDPNASKSSERSRKRTFSSSDFDFAERRSRRTLGRKKNVSSRKLTSTMVSRFSGRFANGSTSSDRQRGRIGDLRLDKKTIHLSNGLFRHDRNAFSFVFHRWFCRCFGQYANRRCSSSISAPIETDRFDLTFLRLLDSTNESGKFTTKSSFECCFCSLSRHRWLFCQSWFSIKKKNETNLFRFVFLLFYSIRPIRRLRTKVSSPCTKVSFPHGFVWDRGTLCSSSHTNNWRNSMSDQFIVHL